MHLDGIGWDGLLKAPSVPINLKLNFSIVVDTGDLIEVVKDVLRHNFIFL